MVLSWLCFRYKTTTSVVAFFSNKRYPIYQKATVTTSCLCFQNWHRCHIFLSSKKYARTLMRCSPSSTVDIKLPSSFLSFYQRRSRRLPKHRFEMAMLALLKTSDHHAMCSPLFQKTPTMSEHVQGSSSLAMHIKSPPLTLLSSQTFLFLSTKKHTPTPMPALLKSTWNKDMFFSLSETTSADLYAQGASGLVIHIQLAPGTLLS